SRSDDEFAPEDPPFQLLKTEAVCLPARQSVQTDPVLAACKHKVQRHQNVIHQRLAVPGGLHSDTAFPAPDTGHHSACCIKRSVPSQSLAIRHWRHIDAGTAGLDSSHGFDLCSCNELRSAERSATHTIKECMRWKLIVSYSSIFRAKHS